MARENPRQLRYWRETIEGEQEQFNNRWTLLIINTPEEIERIMERSLGVFAGVGEFNRGVESRVLSEGKFPDLPGMGYCALEVLSTRGKIEYNEWETIYASPGRRIRERKLGGEKENPEFWFYQLARNISGLETDE